MPSHLPDSLLRLGRLKKMAQSQLLHGNLLVTIGRAKLYRDANLSRKIIEKAKQVVARMTGNGLYVTVDINGKSVGRTSSVSLSSNPQWNEQLRIMCAYEPSSIELTLRQQGGAPYVQSENYSLSKLLASKIIRRNEVDNNWLDYQKKDCEIQAKFRFDPVVASENQGEVPYTFFRQRTKCRVTLYQDADVSDSFVRENPLVRERKYEARSCWEDTFDAISNAKEFVYISGWSINTKITLIRNTRRSEEDRKMNLGELLKKKANEGVQVLILVWKDSLGFMKTYWKETEEFFKNTGVQCVLSSRDIHYTHHQKTVVVDNDGKVVSFLGGLDLCHGRYDTQDHSLFKTLSTCHKDDFHQGNSKGASINEGGPRQPWHDIHCKIEGQASWDVLENFKQRWDREGAEPSVEQFKSNQIVYQPNTSENHQELWNVQVFRSIDSQAATFPDDLEQEERGLVSGDKGVFERSIQDAYIHTIRNAKRFIYIENQYFIGSSFDRKSKHSQALNLIPKELALKIVSKIRKGERFTVYVLIPMHPEGVVDGYFLGVPISEILDMQAKTMEMMYTDIIHALKEKGIEASKAEEYLLFLCLGNREVKKPGEREPSESFRSKAYYHKARKNGRFMTYIHSKMMITDDEHIIVGSANINERSMNGARDTEIAIGAYQPNYIYQGEESPRGQIHGFRMSLWYEHLRQQNNDVFLTPQSEECVAMVNKLARQNWDQYVSDTLNEDLSGHLLKYPIQVTENGKIETLPEQEDLPDAAGVKVLGQASGWEIVEREC